MAINIFPTGIIFTEQPVLVSVYDANNTEDNFKYILEVRVWAGDRNTPPAQATYTLSKFPSPAGSAVFDLSGIIRSYINGTDPRNYIEAAAGQLVNNAGDCVWVRVAQTYISDGPSVPGTSNSATRLAVRGYTLSGSALNGDGIVLNALAIGGKAYFPKSAPWSVQIATSTVKKVVITTANGIVHEVVNGLSADLASQAIVSLSVGCNLYGDGAFGYMKETWESDGAIVEAEECIKAIISTDNDAYTIQYLNDSDEVVQSQEVNCQCTGRYEGGVIGYINRLGGLEYIPVLGASKTAMNFERSKYQNRFAEVGQSTITYDSAKGTQRIFRANGKRSLSLNTGFQPEEVSDKVEEMMQSTFVFYYSSSGEYTPIIPTATNAAKLTHLNDKAVNYTLQFEVAQDYRNQVGI